MECIGKQKGQRKEEGEWWEEEMEVEEGYGGGSEGGREGEREREREREREVGRGGSKINTCIQKKDIP